MPARLAAAFRLLTVPPLPVHGGPAGWAAALVPLAGVLIGAAGYGVFRLCDPWLPRTLVALVVVVFWTLVSRTSGGGWAGVIAWTVSAALRWQTLARVAFPVLPLFIATQAIPRAAMVALVWVSRPVPGGRAATFAATMSTPSALGAIALGLVAALANGAAFASVLVGISAALVLALRRYSHRHFGGVTGACLAAVCHLLELAILALAVWFSYPLEP